MFLQKNASRIYDRLRSFFSIFIQHRSALCDWQRLNIPYSIFITSQYIDGTRVLRYCDKIIYLDVGSLARERNKIYLEVLDHSRNRRSNE